MKDLAEVRKLSVPERLELVGAIWQSILDDPSLLTVSDALAKDLDQRLADHRAHPESSESWEAVNRDIFGAD